MWYFAEQACTAHGSLDIEGWKAEGHVFKAVLASFGFLSFVLSSILPFPRILENRSRGYECDWACRFVISFKHFYKLT